MRVEGSRVSTRNRCSASAEILDRKVEAALTNDDDARYGLDTHDDAAEGSEGNLGAFCHSGVGSSENICYDHEVST